MEGVCKGLEWEAENLMLEGNEDLDRMECFVLEEKKFVRLLK